MSDLIEIQGQIEKLQKQAGEIRAREFDKTVLEIQAKMQAFGITAKHLLASKKRSSKIPAKTKAAGKTVGSPKKPVASVPAKFRGPNGEVWSGRGLMPRWLRALEALGQKKEDFAV